MCILLLIIDAVVAVVAFVRVAVVGADAVDADVVVCCCCVIRLRLWLALRC